MKYSVRFVFGISLLLIPAGLSAENQRLNSRSGGSHLLPDLASLEEAENTAGNKVERDKPYRRAQLSRESIVERDVEKDKGEVERTRRVPVSRSGGSGLALGRRIPLE